eukprot:CAMPEP_0168399994 /NCGR_PEP_ID=MMETSP0228-20121227/22371_1 /TAXON_ID=133427 /ORGANISM="Protoceratium reticulatum, Strain CCCM 535 (=CCMP 1889)" /LENGTH=308 /DNA_ID=CAMNT_0008413525 /DNA_START=55 /DNA_END=977 /DNA_ORIENTATION=+
MGGGQADAQAVAVAKCVGDIEVADFVALDLEFSGLFTGVDKERRMLSQDDYFQKCVESIPEFLALSLGVCCGCKRQDSSTWELRSHEFNLWPQDRRIFSVDLQSLRFLRSHGFDFNAYFQEAHPYRRLPPLQPDGASLANLGPPGHATHVLAALRKARVPLVFHNGLLDCLHLHDKFVGELPDEKEEFAESWTAQFPLLFDTRLLAQEGRFQVLKHSGGLSLGELHKHLSSLTSTTVSFERLGPLGQDTTAHGSAGHDARLTAEVFLREMDLWLRSDALGGGKKKRKLAAGAADGGEATGAPSDAAAA